MTVEPMGINSFLLTFFRGCKRSMKVMSQSGFRLCGNSRCGFGGLVCYTVGWLDGSVCLESELLQFL